MQRLDPWKIALQGTHLIEASAGTGKTYAITNLYLRLLLERGEEVSQLLVVTYTRAATAELRDRIRRRLLEAQRIVTVLAREGPRPTSTGDESLHQWLADRATQGLAFSDAQCLAQALRGFDQAAIFTIHGFCQRVLQDSAFESSVEFDTEFVSDQTALLAEVAQDFWASHMYEASEGWLRYIQSCKPALTVDSIVGLTARIVQAGSVRVIPEPSASASFGQQGARRAEEAVLAQFAEAQLEAARLWTQQGPSIVKLLCESKALNRRQYNVASIQGPWSEALTEALRPQTVGLPASFPQFEKFTPAGLAKGTKKNQTPPEHEFFFACQRLQEASQALGVLRLSLEQQLVDFVRVRLRERKGQLSVQSFDDLLTALATALESDSGSVLAASVRRQYGAALIDEFQDTDPLQYRIFSRVYSASSSSTVLYLIGDPKQAIYAFRGADIFAYLRARDDAGQNCYTLDVNWRSDPSMIGAVNALLSRAPSPFVFEQIGFEPVQAAPGAADRLKLPGPHQGSLQVAFLTRDDHSDAVLSKGEAERRVARAVVRDVVQWLSDGATIEGRLVAPGDLAILVRSNAQAQRLQQGLREVGVAAVVDGESSVFDSAEAVEVHQLLCAVLEPANTARVVAALATELIGMTANELDQLQAQEALLDEWIERFRRWELTWIRRGFIQAYRQLLGEQQVASGVLRRPGGDRRLTNYYHLGELLQAQAVSNNLGPQPLLSWYGQMLTDRNARAQSVGDTSQVRLETDSDAVQLVTVHKSKGLEYPIVLCPFLWNSAQLHDEDKRRVLFHDPEQGDEYQWDFGTEDLGEHVQWAEREALAEASRLLYVALTRAKHLTCLYWGGFRGAAHCALGRLLHVPQNPSTSVEGLERWANHIAELSDEQMLGDLHRLQADSSGKIEVVLSAEGPPRVFHGAEAPQTPLSPRAAQRVLNAGTRLSSFTGLTAGGASREAHAVELDARDRDAEAVAAFAGIAGQTEIKSLAPPGQPSTTEVAPAGQEVALAHFPRGARVGVMLHEVFENLSFSGATLETIQPVVEGKLRTYGMDSELSEPLSQALWSILRCPLVDEAGEGPGIALVDVNDAQRLDEMEFLFPVALHSQGLRPQLLAAVLARHQPVPWASDYPGRVAALGFSTLNGYLRGFVDLIFCHQGRYYVADYKSNYLGPSRENYRSVEVERAMAEGHYYLQSLIYLVALHRYLSLRLPGYAYEQHIGGIAYLFLRGMSVDHPVGTGIHLYRPSESLVEQLSDAFQGERPPRGAV